MCNLAIILINISYWYWYYKHYNYLPSIVNQKKLTKDFKMPSREAWVDIFEVLLKGRGAA